MVRVLTHQKRNSLTPLSSAIYVYASRRFARLLNQYLESDTKNCLHRKIFAHEHALYTHAQLGAHLPSYRRHGHGPKDSKFKAQDVDGGIHPFCDFCRESYFGDDELYAHMRERHEECFICKSNDIRHQ